MIEKRRKRIENMATITAVVFMGGTLAAFVLLIGWCIGL